MEGFGHCVECSKLVREAFDGLCRKCFEQAGGMVLDEERLRRILAETERWVEAECRRMGGGR